MSILSARGEKKRKEVFSGWLDDSKQNFKAGHT